MIGGTGLSSSIGRFGGIGLSSSTGGIGFSVSCGFGGSGSFTSSLFFILILPAHELEKPEKPENSEVEAE